MKHTRWFFVIAAVALLGAIGVLGLQRLNRDAEGGPDAIIAAPEPTRRAAPRSADRQAIVFREHAKEAGLEFRYRSGARGEYHLTETLGGGVGLLDYDGDGWLDVYLIQGGAFPPRRSNREANRLYRNRGDGTFADVTEGSGLGHTGYGHGCAIGDYDNDGDPDVYVANFGKDVLFRNNGDGTFSDVTDETGLGCLLSGTGCAFGDLDGDGDLDLYVANYVEIDAQRPLRCEDSLGLRIYCPPPHHRAQPDVMYRNNGDGTFSDVTQEAGVRDEDGRGLGVLIADVTQDGRQDIYVANDATANFLFVGANALHFEERALQQGLALSRDGQAEGSMGIAYGDYDNSGSMDLLVTNFMDETNTLYHGLGDGLFADRTGRAGLGPLTRSMVGWGTQLIDFDNDAVLDLFVTNGNINNIESESGEEYAMRALLLAGGEDGRFRDVSNQAGAYFSARWSGRGAAFGDLDNDGDIDIVVSQLDEPAALLRNETPLRGASLMLRLVGRPAAQGGSNRDALGARVEVQVGQKRLVRELVGGASYLSSSSSMLHVGLGKDQKVESVVIRWPSGRRQECGPVAVKKEVTEWIVVEGKEPVVVENDPGR